MARLVGVDLPRDKRMEIALTYIYGIGRTRSQEILAATNIARDLRSRYSSQDRDRLLPGSAAPPRPAGARPADQDQRAYP